MTGLNHIIKIYLDKEANDFIINLLEKITGNTNQDRLRLILLTGAKLIEQKILSGSVPIYVPFNSKLMRMDFVLEEVKNGNK